MNTLFAVAKHVRTVYDCGKTSGGGRLSLQLVDLSVIPGFSLGVTILLNNVVGVKVVHTNLSTCRSGRAPEIREGLAYLFPTVVGNGSKRGVVNGVEGEFLVGPYAVEVLALFNVTIDQLVEDSKRPDFVGHDRDTSAWGRGRGRHEVTCCFWCE